MSGSVVKEMRRQGEAAVSIVMESFRSFLRDEPFRLAAALSYYSLLSIAPLLIIVIAVAGLVFGETVVRAELIDQMGQLIGEEGAYLAATVIENTGDRGTNRLSLMIGTAMLLVGATAVFAQLQSALNHIWHVQAAPTNAVWAFLRRRLLSFALILTLGFLMMVSLAVSAVLAALRAHMNELVPGMPEFWEAVNTIVSFGLMTVLVAMIFKYLPDTAIHWRDTWLGAFITAVLFIGGKYAIGMYIGQAGVGSPFGAAGSVVVFLVWVYMVSLIFFFGAEITCVMAGRRRAGVSSDIESG